MNRASIHQAFVEPTSSVNLKLKEIDDLLVEYPWFTGGYLIKLSKLKLENDFRFDSFLSQTAVRFQDRAALKLRVEELENPIVEKIPEPSTTPEFSTNSDDTEKNIREIGASYRHVMEYVEKAINSSESDSFIPEFHSVVENPAKPIEDDLAVASSSKIHELDTPTTEEIESYQLVENQISTDLHLESQVVEDSIEDNIQPEIEEVVSVEETPIEAQPAEIQLEETVTEVEHELEFLVEDTESESTSLTDESNEDLSTDTILDDSVASEYKVTESTNEVAQVVEHQSIPASNTFSSLADFLYALQPEIVPKPALPEIKELIPDYIASVDYFKVKDEPIAEIAVEQVVTTSEEKEDLFEEPISDTLARIYEMQGAYAMAIEVYEKLCLKFPNKKSYFAGRIETIQTKINQK